MRGLAWLFDPNPPAPAPAGRDLRLDFFRGLALAFIFLNHIPDNAASWLSSRNWGFSDATEIFVFVSGYSAALAYGAVLARSGFMACAAKIGNRVWQIYVAHIVLFVLFVAQIAYVVEGFDNSLYAEEMNVVDFMHQPHVVIAQALLLKFRPVNMDVLPLYVVLLAAMPAILWGLRRRAAWVLVGSAVLWWLSDHLKWNLPAYPGNKGWYFNPLCWQFLFVLGAWFGTRHGTPSVGRLRRTAFVPAAAAFLVFALMVVATWSVPGLNWLVPSWLARLLYPIDKTNLDLLRLLHFLALAYLTVILVKPDAAFLDGAWARPLVLMGQHSLYVFCVGVFLSFVGHFVLVEFGDSVVRQFAVSLTGIALMLGLAAFLRWYRRIEGGRTRA